MKHFLLLIFTLFCLNLEAQMRYNNFEIVVGAERFQSYEEHLTGKNVGCVVNQTSFVGSLHLVDFLRHKKVKVSKIFAPEHGFRGKADAGESVKDGKDSRTGLPIFSLHGKHKKPSVEMLSGLDVVIFDIQDVGARFYTYISTLHYVMEACAEQGIKVIILDRPNPNGHYVDGFVLEKEYTSFVGMHQIPVVHGMTVGELACMINQEGWLKDKNGNVINCDFEIIECLGYDHTKFYKLPVKPSPNLPNINSIYLYPSLCFFEGTQVSVGRGTEKQFQIMGFPGYKFENAYEFNPVSREGAKYPKHENKSCKGVDLSLLNPIEFRQKNQIQWEYLIDMYHNYTNNGRDQKAFFLSNNFINKLAGTSRLKKAVIEGKTADEIRAMYAAELAEFKALRKQYLLYNDFE